jgi:NAD+ synthase (glutamine-hydrolysing)
MTQINTALAQINVTVGDLAGNRKRILQAARQAEQNQADLVVFPELALSGYPPEDLVLKKRFLDDCEHQLQQLALELPAHLITVLGAPLRIENEVRNAAAVIFNHEVQAVYSKMLLPNYSVFDEKRHFAQGDAPLILRINQDLRIGIHICEDSWFADKAPSILMKKSGISALLNLSASPFHRRKQTQRETVLAATARFIETDLLYCNLVGGQDELVFDGTSLVMRPDGSVAARGKQFQEQMLYYTITSSPAESKPLPHAVNTVDFQLDSKPPYPPPSIAPLLSELEEIYQALVLGVHDYVEKNRFKQVVIALSGGIDSALVAVLAVDALGPDRVTCITMPSQYTSDETRSDAEILAANLGVQLHTVPIKELYDAYISQIKSFWADQPADTTEENLQARIRGNIIMAFSNKFGWMVLTTGNKSEMATGYCTIYGDMAGGFALIKDVPKTIVFDLCRWRNAQQQSPVIPPSIISRPPSAELRPDQKDSDSLPPYELLDAILERYVEQDKGIQEIIDEGFEPAIVRRVAKLVDLNEYKRRQGPPGIKITPKAFGRDRRMPITNRYEELNP